jgi:tetratricopeptide (TPR) repeat protein
MVRRSIRFYWDGDLTRAFSSLQKAPKDIRDARFYLYRAALFLTVGRVVLAREDISKALILDPSNSSAFALQSIMDVVQNKKDKALSLANKAVELDSKSSTAGVALSYAQQANFNIQGALKSLQEAVQLDPENALAWARLAELFLSVGDLDKAVDSAKEAVALNPGLARTQSVLGYAYLTRIKIKDAKNAFRKAIELDSAAPLPRLGLGLAIIREGDLEAGRAEIEIASGLDPNNSLIRSYLGKAYYDEKQDKLARDQFAVAKELDPLDPTPWFYDAIRKQTTNRPVEALQDMQKSIELNDNRAVYRSRLLLDEDLAARSASLGRIYSDLGFQQLGLVEGWKSVNTAPANFSAHRLLADLYADLPRHEIARVSELLQSQLLQPLNITPVQPSLAESNLFVLEGAGPSDPSFNEFNPLFLRNRFALQASMVGGGKNTVGDELVHSAVWNKLSYSLGQFHFQTDGFRQNNDQDQDILNAYAQVSLSHKTSVQAEIRRRDVERGSFLGFDPNNISETFRRKDDVKTIRFGIRHAFSSNADTIASIIYQDTDIDSDLFPGSRIEFDQDGYLAEIQQLFSSKRFDLIGGLGHLSVDQKTATKLDFFPIQIEPVKSDIHYNNLYGYIQINYPDSVTWTLGGSGDFFEGLEGDALEGDKFSPKFGLTWNPFPSTTLRAAGFRTIRRTLVSEQTLEPTQIAGFNQFFDEPEGTDAWRYGFGVDQKIGAQLYIGAEFTKGDLDVPQLLQTGTESRVRKEDRDEKQFRAYLYWAPHPWLALNTEFFYDRFEKEISSPPIVKTKRLPLGISLFHPSGFSVGLKATYVDQEGEFEESGIVVPGEDRFWVVDASVGYRLPNRFGFITINGRNLFNQHFRFEEEDLGNPVLSRERLILTRFTLAF